MLFQDEYLKFWQKIGANRKMVLSTSLNNIVTSRMMSVIMLREKLYFQTDRTMRKYEQLKGNPLVSLCIDNIQIEGTCTEIGKPSEHPDFLNVYQNSFPSSFDRYSLLENERLFVVEPTHIEQWRYIDNVPYMEIFDVPNLNYILKKYEGV